MGPGRTFRNGRSPDEYELEIREIFQRMNEVEYAQQLALLIQEVFNRYFAPAFSFDFQDRVIVARKMFEE
jgi:hypothetical protein